MYFLYTTKHSVHEDFLNGLTPNGFPSHELILKPNCLINPSKGLCNGTHFICHRFDQNVIDIVISISRHCCGKRVFFFT